MSLHSLYCDYCYELIAQTEVHNIPGIPLRREIPQGPVRNVDLCEVCAGIVNETLRNVAGLCKIRDKTLVSVKNEPRAADMSTLQLKMDSINAQRAQYMREKEYNAPRPPLVDVLKDWAQ